jgi:allophanate hydrolase
VPFAVKDNIDVAGLPTTAACPDFAYRRKADATCVARLRAAGRYSDWQDQSRPVRHRSGRRAVRPTGSRATLSCKNSIPRRIEGSGSAVAVAAAWCRFRLGTDTAGSGRIPGGPRQHRGTEAEPRGGLDCRVSCRRAARSIASSVFALSVDEAWTAFSIMAGPDIADPYTRNSPIGTARSAAAVAHRACRSRARACFFGDQASAAEFEAAIARFAGLGATIVEIDIEPFYETARLLYEGPWVAERYLAAQKLIASSPESMHPVTREIILGWRASDCHGCLRGVLQARRPAPRARSCVPPDRRAARADHADVYTVEQVLADPIQLNSRLGTYTNFVNLLDLCGLALPASLRRDDIPFGVTVLAPGGQRRAARLARPRVSCRHRAAARRDRQEPADRSRRPLQRPAPGEIAIAVVGAHMSGMAAQRRVEVVRRRFLEAPDRAALPAVCAANAVRLRGPGCLRVATTVASIALVIWRCRQGRASDVSSRRFPAPLSICNADIVRRTHRERIPRRVGTA